MTKVRDVSSVEQAELSSLVGVTARLQPGNPEPKASSSVVVVMPAYNAAETLERTYDDIPHDLVDHIILVDDVSADETVQIAKHLGLDVIVHQRNRGYGGNQKTCYDRALEIGAQVVVMLHPDYQYDATRIGALIEPPGRRHAAVEVRVQPLPNGRREPRVWPQAVGVSHRLSRVPPSGARGPPVSREQRRLRVRPAAGRPGSARRLPDRRDRGPHALLQGGELCRISPERGLRPIDPRGGDEPPDTQGSRPDCRPPTLARLRSLGEAVDRRILAIPL